VHVELVNDVPYSSTATRALSRVCMSTHTHTRSSALKFPSHPLFLHTHRTSATVVAFATGRTRQLADVQEAVASARGRAMVAPPAVARSNTTSLFLPMRDVIAWNTVYTHALHVCVLRLITTDLDASKRAACMNAC
jgi:hypothetical protein